MIRFLFRYIEYEMYGTIGKEKYARCDILKNLSDEKGIQYHYLDMMGMPHKIMTYLKMYCTSYPMVLSVNHFSNFDDTLEHFNKI